MNISISDMRIKLLLSFLYHEKEWGEEIDFHGFFQMGCVRRIIYVILKTRGFTCSLLSPSDQILNEAQDSRLRNDCF